MQRTSWARVEIGQVVTFRYKGKRKDSVSRKRRCLILNPNHRYTRKDGRRVRLVHALQLTSNPKRKGQKNLSSPQINRLVESVYEVQAGPSQSSSPKIAYKTINQVIGRINSPIYRTFAWYILNRNGVWITDDLKLTPKNKQRLFEISFSTTREIDETDF